MCFIHRQDCQLVLVEFRGQNSRPEVRLKSRLEVPGTRDKTAMLTRFRALAADLWPGHLAITGISSQRDNRLRE
jgi:hypothetical protein